jgi:hypothetical protein
MHLRGLFSAAFATEYQQITGSGLGAKSSQAVVVLKAGSKGARE